MEFHASWTPLWNRSDTLPDGDTMKKTLIPLALAALLCTFIACDTEDPPASPGTLTVNWTDGDVPTCGSRNIETLRVWISHPSDELLSTSQEVECPAADTAGSVLFEEVMPATYQVGVDGIHADGQIYYAGTGEVAVADGADAESAPVKLDKKRSTLHVEYEVWSQCHKAEDAGLDNVTVTIYEPDEDDSMAMASGACDASFADDATGENSWGLLFTDLDPVDVIVVVKALDDPDASTAGTVGTVESATDADGNPIELINGNIPLKLDPGLNHKIVVTLSQQ